MVEFERSLIRERPMAGLAAARARGRTGDRPKVMDAAMIQRGRELRETTKCSLDEIAGAVGVSRRMLLRYLGGEVGGALDERRAVVTKPTTCDGCYCGED